MSTITEERYQLSVVLRSLKEKNTTEYEKYISTLRELNKENTSEIVEAILSDKTRDLLAQLKLLHRFSNLISKTIENPSDQLLLQLGELQGISLLAQELIFTKDEKKNETEIMQKHLANKYTKKILKYLYLHPSAGHKELAEAISVKVNYLSELLKVLIDDDIVRKTRQSKYSFYSLSYQANEYTKTKLINGLNGKNNSYPFSPFSQRTNTNYVFEDNNSARENILIFTNLNISKNNMEEEDAS